MFKVSLKQFVKDLNQEVSNHNVYNGAATLAYYLMLSIFPGTILMLTLLPYLPIPHLQQAIMDVLGQVLPQESAKMFTGVVNDVLSNRHGGLLSFGLIFTLWSASTGLYAIMQQINITYEVKESRPFWKVRGTALLLMALFFILVVGGFGLIVFGGVIQNWVGNHLGWSSPLRIFFAAFRWVVILVSLLLAFSTFYYFGPDVEQEFKFITPGSVFGVLMLALATVGFRIYMTEFANYNATYGSIGAVIVLQLWLYIVGLVLLVGSEVNILFEQSHPEGKRKGEKEEPEERRAA